MPVTVQVRPLPNIKAGVDRGLFPNLNIWTAGQMACPERAKKKDPLK
jgi:hypothetical protein